MKRRGRKPKNQVEKKDDANKEPVKKNRRGRKPKTVYNIDETLILKDFSSSLSDDENIICCLNVNGSEKGLPVAYNHDYQKHQSFFHNDNFDNCDDEQNIDSLMNESNNLKN